MKILQIITKSDPIGGAQVVLLNLVKYLKEVNDIIVIVGEFGKLTDELEKIGAKFIVLKSLVRAISPIHDIRAFIEIKKLIKQIKPDIVASHSTKAGYITRLVCYNIKQPNVFTIHGWAFTEGVPIIRRKIYLNIELFAGLFTDHLIAVSDYDRKLGIKSKIVRKEKIKTIHNGVPDLFVSGNNVKDENTNLKGIMVARFQSQKDHNTLFSALNQLKHKNIQIDLLGDGPLLEHFRKLAKKLKIEHMINFQGVRMDIGNFLNKADFFILTTNYEGFPLTIIEAMSCGLPIIATDVGGVKESVIDGFNGNLVRRGDVGSVVHAINLLYEQRDLLKKYSENSRKLYLEEFTVQIMTEKILDYYREIISK